MKVIIAAIFFTLAFTSLNAIACKKRMYVGNPERVNTIWMPGMCDNKGVWHNGYYVHFKKPVKKSQLIWLEGSYDKCGNWVKAHWHYKHGVAHGKWCKMKCACHKK